MEYNSKTVQGLSYMVFGLGIFGFGIYWMNVVFASFPLDMGIVSATTATTLLGFIGIVVGKCLQSVEDRLDRLEHGRSSSKISN
jgi:apolipoprotein N-acyltransferase